MLQPFGILIALPWRSVASWANQDMEPPRKGLGRQSPGLEPGLHLVEGCLPHALLRGAMMESDQHKGSGA